MAPEWLNFNIFWWILFYIINRYKIHIIVELELYCSINVGLRPEKPLKFQKNVIISKSQFLISDVVKMTTSHVFFNISSWNFGNMLRTVFAAYLKSGFWKKCFKNFCRWPTPASRQKFGVSAAKGGRKFFFQIRSLNKQQNRFWAYSQNFRTKYWKIREFYSFWRRPKSKIVILR